MYFITTEKIIERGILLEGRGITIERMHIVIYPRLRASRWFGEFIKEQFPPEYIDWLKWFLFKHPVIVARL